MPLLINSLDLLVVMNQPSAFGNYSYPVKLYEAMSCNVQVVATRTLATEWILGSHPECLVEPADAEGLSAAILRALSQPDVDYRNVPTWDSSCDRFEHALLSEHM